MQVSSDFRLAPRCKRDLWSSGMLRSVDWRSVTEVSGQTISHVFKGQALQEDSSWIALPLKTSPTGCPETPETN
jgi:hypothetical protein